MVIRQGPVQYAAPTQLVPLGPCAQQAQEALQALQKYLQGKIPEKPVSEISATINDFKWKEYRTGTKNLMIAFANAIQQTMPKGFSLKSCCPPNPLVPSRTIETRDKLTEKELRAMGLESRVGQSLYYCFDHKTFEARNDFYHSDDFWRVTFAADEGTEARVSNTFV